MNPENRGKLQTALVHFAEKIELVRQCGDKRHLAKGAAEVVDVLEAVIEIEVRRRTKEGV